MATGAVALIETAVRAGVEVCFANPGTSEMPLVVALDHVPGIRAVLCLFEGVCTGAADGWARMTGRPAATLLHHGPGFANGLANLHNARRAHTPVVNWVGDHATHHLAFDTPLTSDILALTRSVGWTRTVRLSQEMAEAGLAAVYAALGPPGRVASLIIPTDCQWQPAAPTQAARPSAVPREVPCHAVREAGRLLRSGAGGLLLGGSALTERGLRAAARVAAATGGRVWIETFPSRLEGGRHLPGFAALPYFPAQAREALAGVRNLVLVGAREPVSFFAYPDEPSRLVPRGGHVHMLADPDIGSDATRALEALGDEVDAPPEVAGAGRAVEAFVPANRPLDPDSLGRILAEFLPEAAIVVNEAATTGITWGETHATTAAPHTMLGHTGGAIGQGLPIALGAALACPGRRVIAYQADGSGLYTLQALWSMARENADVTVVVCANRRYRVLQAELARATAEPGAQARALTELAPPPIDWVALARGFGVPGCAARTDSEFAAAMARALAEPGPSLIEAVLA
jgi:acetolactate synthase-1/2/3 large subunit